MNRLALAVLPDVYSEKAGMNPAFPHIIISLIVLVFEDGLPHIQNLGRVVCNQIKYLLVIGAVVSKLWLKPPLAEAFSFQ